MSQSHTHPSQITIGSPQSATRGNVVQASNTGASHASHDAASTISTTMKEAEYTYQSFNQSFQAANAGMHNAFWLKK
jgi:hypothetical protein